MYFVVITAPKRKLDEMIVVATTIQQQNDGGVLRNRDKYPLGSQGSGAHFIL